MKKRAKYLIRLRKRLLWVSPLLAVTVSILIMMQCSSTQEPEPPTGIEMVSGNDQYYIHGTTLAEPLVVRATTKSGSPAESALIRFQVTGGNAVLSASLVRTNADGLASVLLTLSPENGINTVRASLEINTDKYVVFTATSSDFPCREAETSHSVDYGPSGNLLLATFKSAIYSSDETNAGIVMIGSTVTGLKEFPTDIFITTVWDIALSPRGDLFLAKSAVIDEIVKVGTDGSVTPFAILEDPDGAELATNPSGLVVGCDRKGPFLIGCDKTVHRFDGASYPSGGINNNALAVDPTTEDIYYISTIDLTLYRLPVDSFSATGPPEEAASLSMDEAIGARGMVADMDGTVYILVDTTSTKELIKIDSQGDKTGAFDFFSRGPGNLAGTQRDLALDRNAGKLYTIDTLNNQLLYFFTSAPNQVYTVMTSEDISTSDFSGERVGLVVLP
jgi:hypothetical protein